MQFRKIIKAIVRKDTTTTSEPPLPPAFAEAIGACLDKLKTTLTDGCGDFCFRVVVVKSPVGAVGSMCAVTEQIGNILDEAYSDIPQTTVEDVLLIPQAALQRSGN